MAGRFAIRRDMRICILRHPSTIHCRRWAVAFANRGHDVQIVYFEGDLDTWGPLPVFSDLDAAGVNVEMLTIRRTQKRMTRNVERQLMKFPFLNPYDEIRVAALKEYLGRARPDVMYSLGLDYYGYWGARSEFAPHLAAALGSDIANPEMGSAQRKRLAIACGATCIHLHDDYGHKRLAELGCEPQQVHLNQWGVDTDHFNPSLRSDKIREQLLGDGDFLITCIRNLKSLYDLPTLLRAVPAVLAELPGTRFLLIGEGAERSKLTAIATELGIRQQVTFAGDVEHDKVAQLLACSDVMVDAIHSRPGGGGLGMALLEAMSSGVPLVIAAKPWAKGVVIEGETGYQFQGGDASDMAAKMLTLLKNPERLAIGQRCREMALQRFNWEQTVTEIEILCKKLIK